MTFVFMHMVLYNKHGDYNKIYFMPQILWIIYGGIWYTVVIAQINACGMGNRTQTSIPRTYPTKIKELLQ